MEARRGGPARWARSAALWARARLALWVVLVGAFNAALITLVAVLTSLPGQSHANISGLILVLLVLLMLSVGFPVAGHLVQRREYLDAEYKRRLDHIDRLLSAGSSRQLPRLSQLTDDRLGATPTRYSMAGLAPYVERPGDDSVIRALLAANGPPYPFVIVWGDTLAGKSRTLAEALRATFLHSSDDPVVVLPRDGSALAELSGLGLTVPEDSGPALVVLDDLDLADLEVLTSDVLDKVTEWAVIAATMTAQRRGEVLKSRGKVGAVARTALEHKSRQYELSSEPPTGMEKAEAERLYPGERFEGSVAETLAGGRELVARYKASRDQRPAACAVLRAAIDCRRAGLSRPVTEAELLRLFPLYLHMVRIDLAPTVERFRDGVEWAAQPVSSQVALLQRVTPVKELLAWRIFDHAVTADEGRYGQQPRAIPGQTWTELLDFISADDALGVGYAAYTHGNIACAISAFRKVNIVGYEDVTAAATGAVGTLLAQQGDLEGARDAYQHVIDSGHTDAAAMAALKLGELLAGQGDEEGARAAYQQAAKSRNASWAARGAIELGGLLAMQGDVKGARAAYQQAIDSGDTDYGWFAEWRLADLLAEEGDKEGARAARQHARDSYYASLNTKAALNVGTLFDLQGNVETARAHYQQATESGHVGIAPLAAARLGELLSTQGDVEGARAAYQQVIDSGHPSYAPLGAVSLGDLLTEQGDMEGARAAYQQAIDSGHASASTLARQRLDEMELGKSAGVERAHPERFWRQFGIGVDDVEDLGL
jgi:predicted negative regulator of RcsB-dependent stress response